MGVVQTSDPTSFRVWIIILLVLSLAVIAADAYVTFIAQLLWI